MLQVPREGTPIFSSENPAPANPLIILVIVQADVPPFVAAVPVRLAPPPPVRARHSLVPQRQPHVAAVLVCDPRGACATLPVVADAKDEALAWPRVALREGKVR